MSSCDREVGKPLVIPNNKQRVTPEAKQSYLSLSIQSTNAVVLRSTSLDPMTQIKNLMLLFYDTTGTLKDIKDIKANAGVAKQDIRVKLPAADYKLLVLANPSEKVRAQLHLGARLEALEQGLTLFSGDLFNQGQSSQVMANEQGVVSISKSSFSTTEAGSQSQVINIQLEPTLARILVYGVPSLRAATKGNKPIKYCVNNLPKQVYLYRKLAKLSTGVMERLGDQSQATQRYAESPLWAVWSDVKPQNTEGIAYYPLEYLSASSMGCEALGDISDYQSLLGQSTLYWKESTMPEAAFLQGIAPYVHIAFPYIPQGLTLKENEGWLSYQGQLYTETRALELLNNTQSTEPLAISLRNAGIKAEDFRKVEGFSRDGINFYYQGYSYYAVFIKHFAGSAGYGKYGIVRGNEYRIQLLSINNPGSPTPIRFDNNLDAIEESKASGFEVRVRSLGEINQTAEL